MARACKRNGIRVYAAGTRSSNKVKKAALVTKLKSRFQTGRVHILLVGQLRGRSRVYLKELNHLMRLAPKPFSINGVALKRENGRYCINARTKVAPPHMVGEYFSTHCDEVTSVLTRSSKNSAESVIDWIQHKDIQTMDVERGEQLRYELQGTKGHRYSSNVAKTWLTMKAGLTGHGKTLSQNFCLLALSSGYYFYF